MATHLALAMLHAGCCVCCFTHTFDGAPHVLISPSLFKPINRYLSAHLDWRSTKLQVARYEEDADGVTLHFDGEQPSVHAKLLVGADGYFSRIRKQCLNDGPPVFAVRPCRDEPTGTGGA